MDMRSNKRDGFKDEVNGRRTCPMPQLLSRRQAVGMTIAAAFTATGRQSQAIEPANRSGLLMRHQGLDVLDTRTKVVVELDGSLRLKEPDPNKPDNIRNAEVKAKSTLDYFEKIAFQDSTLVGSARRYVEATSENWIAGSAGSQELRPECKQTVMLEREGTWQQYCQDQPLDTRETSLLHSPINSAALELLLPVEPAKPNSEWVITADDAAHIFNLDAVHAGSLKARIVSVEKGVATIKVTGELDATANSVSTSLKINGSLHAKGGAKCAFVKWLGLAIEETRAISKTEPGFTVSARVQLIREETKSEIAMSDAAIREAAVAEDDGRWLVRIQSTAGRYSMLCDRRWHVFLDTGEEAILRMVENDTIIAQCNISRLPKLNEGSQLTLEGFQSEIKRSLGKGFQQFLNANESVNSSGLRLLRAVAMGESEEVPVQWVYSHVSDDSGRRIALIYAMGGNLTDRFAAADEQMCSSFEMLQEVAAEPTEAPTPAAPLESAKADTDETKR